MKDFKVSDRFSQALWILLDKYHSPPHSEEEQLINYEDFLHVATLGGPKCK
jgi:serine/threonine-protein phosphatase 2A regulatory subunit B''/actin-binding protein anillin